MNNLNKNKDKELCKNITLSLGDIVRYSMNENFRNSCFKLFNVESSKEMQDKIGKSLNTFYQTNFAGETPTKQIQGMKETSLNEKPMQLLEITPKRDVNNTTKYLLQSGNRNWLNIAAQQTKNSIRRQSYSKNKERVNTFVTPSNFNFKNSEIQTLFHTSTWPPSNYPLTPVSDFNLFSFNSPTSYCIPNDTMGLERTRKVLFLDDDEINDL